MVKAELLNKLYELTDTTIVIIRVQWNLYNAIAFKCKMQIGATDVTYNVIHC